MAGLRKKWKRRLAGFLAACMIATSLQGTAMATVMTDYEADEDVVLSLSMANMKEAVSAAVTNGVRYDGSLKFYEGDNTGRASEYEKILNADNVFELEEIPFADNSPTSGMPDDTELRIFVCADKTQLTDEKRATGSELKASDSELGAVQYDVTGEEQIIFLFTNRSEFDLTFQLNVDGVLSPVISVPNGETLGYEIASESEADEEETEEETETAEETEKAEEPSTGGENEMPGNSSGGAGSEITDESKAEEEITDESKSDDEINDESKSEEGLEDESKSDDNPKNDSGADEEIKDDSESKGEVTDDSKSEEKTEDGSKTDEGAKGDSEADKDKADEPKKEESGSESDDKSKTEENSDKTSGNKEESGNKDSKEEGKQTEDKSEKEDSKETEVVILSKSSKEVPRVTAFVPKDSYDLDDPDAPKSPEEEFDMMGLEDDEDVEEYYSSLESGSIAVAEEAVSKGTILEPVFVKKESKTRRIALFSSSEGENSSDTAVLYSNTITGLSNSFDTSKFGVMLYDYSGTNQEPGNINSYLAGKNAELRFNAQTNLGSTIGNAYTYNVNYKDVPLNVVQGLVPKTYSGDGFSGSFFHEKDLFPDEQGSINTKNVRVYKDVKLSDDFFEIDDDGYYTYQSSEQGAQYSNGVLSPASGEKQFWPFSSGGGNWFFGMKMNFNFYMPKDGKVNEKDMIFEFSGDDDIWIYLNEKDNSSHYLALDLGGNHGRMDGIINFATGDITYTSKNGTLDKEKKAPVVSHIYNPSWAEDSLKNVRDKNSSNGSYYTAYASLYSREKTIDHYMTQNRVDRAAAAKAVDNKYIDFMGFDGEYGIEYQLNLYYMERGGTASNCHMKFNMPVIPASGISLMKQVRGKEDKIPENASYQFKLVTSDKKAELEKAQSGAEAAVDTYPIELKAGQTFDMNLPSGTWFYVEETGNAGAATSWSMVGGETASGESTKTGIYQADSSKSGFLVTFTNSFGEMEPKINKSAWLDETGGEYDIALQVTGDSMTTISGADSGANVLYVLDKSGSMSDYSRMKQLRQALDTSLEQLSDKNNINVAMFAYDDNIKSKFNNGKWTELNKETLSKIKQYYNSISPGGNTNSEEALKEAKNVFSNPPTTAKKYLIFVTDGDPCGSGYDEDDNYEINAKEMGDALRRAYGTDELNIYMVGVGKSIKNDWWMHPGSTQGMPDKKIYPSQAIVTYPTAYYNAQEEDLSDLFEEITNQITDTVHVTNPVVTDTLSDEVAPVNVDGSGNSGVPMTMWLYNGELGEEGVTPGIKAASVELSGNRNGSVIIYSAGGREVAKYYLESNGSIPANTIVWTVAEQLASSETKTLIYRVKVTGDYNENKFVTPDDNTGTHSLKDPKETGYRSNKKAELAYNGSETKTFPHPVVRPQAPNGSIIITKEVTDTNGVYESLNGTEVFEFTVNLKNVTADRIFVQSPSDGEPREENVTGSTITLNFSLKDGESYTITGLNEDAGYTITESEYTDDRYISELRSITVKKNEQVDEDGVNLKERQATGTLLNEGGTRIEYSYKESVNVTGNNTIQYGDSVETAEAGEDGWYDNGTLIPLNDDRYFKTEEGKVSKNRHSSIWNYNGRNYYSIESVKKQLETEGYETWIDGNTVHYSKEVEKTKTELFYDGYRYRDYSSKTIEVVPSNEPVQIDILYNNLFDARDSIFVQKEIKADDGVTVPENEAYTFEVRKFNADKGLYEDFTSYEVIPTESTAAEKTERGFTITGSGKVELLIDKNEKNAVFQVKETGRGTADTMEWNGQTMGSDVSGNVKNGGTVTCTNYYTKNTLTISKALTDDSYAAVPENAKKFVYEVTLQNQDGTDVTSVEYDASSAGITLKDGIFNSSTNTISLKGGKFTFIMEAGGSLKLNKIPTGASYKVQEISMADENLAKYYRYELAETMQNGAVLSGNPSSVTGDYLDITSESGKNQTVGYKNRLIVNMGQITVRKEIVDKAGKPATRGANGEIFIFKIANGDSSSVGYGGTFYVSLEIKDGKAEKTLQVPYGEKYTVTEEAHLRYKVYGSDEQVVKTITGQDTATIQNYKVNDSFFSDVSVKVNTVDKNGFPDKNNSPFEHMAPKSSLPSGSVKDDDKNSEEN